MEKVKRPVSVWIAQIVVIFFAALFLIPVVTLIVTLPSSRDVSAIGLIFALFITLGILAVLIISFWGMARRRQWGRWLGVGALSFIVIVSILGQIMRPAMEYYEYANSTEAGAALITQLVIVGLFLWLISTLAFSSRVNAFFSNKENTRTDSELDI
jgi:uncharacterized BrkB/YihY/UPF0761 family membrane protein